uniref:vang-like protein 2 isoform X2 n=1 Tax=Myxine glutinosa TaxID=7769 RepID=UPI00358E6FDD
MDTESQYSGYSYHRPRERSRGDRRRCRERSVTIQAPEPLLEPGSREEQDDNWAETTTVVTSECSASHDDLSRLEKADGEVSRWGADSHGLRSARRRLATAACITIAIATTLSPIAFVVLPQILWKIQWTVDAKIEAKLVALAIKVAAVAVATWAGLVRRCPPSLGVSLPRPHPPRPALALALTAVLVAYWLFYGVRVLDGSRGAAGGTNGAVAAIASRGLRLCVQFASSLADSALWVSLVGLAWIYWWSLGVGGSGGGGVGGSLWGTPAAEDMGGGPGRLVLRVTRTGDGVSKVFPAGSMSIQVAAAIVLERYMYTFPVFNPALPAASRRRLASRRLTGYKVYDVDGNPGGGAEHSQAIMAAAARRRDNSHNDLYYEEAEMERRVRKRRARLVLAAEEAFTHVRCIADGPEERPSGAAATPQPPGGGQPTAQPAPPSPGGPMDPREAAQAVFPAVARALQKFLRATRQQGLHSMEGILRHLAFCLGHGLTARAFLEPYLVPGPSMWYGASAGLNSDWLLISAEAPSSALRPGTCFTMRQSGGLSLVVTATGLPVLRLCESPEDPKSRRFVLRLQSETSV